MQPQSLTAILLIAHGSRRDAANQELCDLAQRLRVDRPGGIVEACFLELAEPDIPAGGRACIRQGATRVLMVPYFLSAGVHLQDDLKGARDELQEAFPNVEFRLGTALGPHPLLDQLVAARIGELDRAESDRD